MLRSSNPDPEELPGALATSWPDLLDKALLHMHQGKKEKAFEVLTEALDIKKELFGERHTNVAEILDTMAQHKS